MAAAQVLNLDYKPISLWREMGAYEALWNESKAGFKSIADKFRQHPGLLPSDFFEINGQDVPQTFAERANALFERAGVKKYRIRLFGDGEYPERLRDAEHPVELLYYRGFWDLIETRCVAVVGTRKPSLKGEKRAEKLVSSLVADGFTVVSGLAAGIDTIAHKTAMAAGAPTIAVIGTPLSSVYPRENAGLQAEIARHHLLISQVPVCRYTEQSWRINKFFFPERNITMSALTEATIIVEASDTSGTLAQARAALKQRRKLLILDSCFKVEGLKWPHTFEQLGAIRIKDYDEIHKHLEA